MWASLDGGATWERVRPSPGLFNGFGSQYILAVNILGDQVLVAGGDDAARAVWVGPLAKAKP